MTARERTTAGRASGFFVPGRRPPLPLGRPTIQKGDAMSSIDELLGYLPLNDDLPRRFFAADWQPAGVAPRLTSLRADQPPDAQPRGMLTPYLTKDGTFKFPIS